MLSLLFGKIFFEATIPLTPEGYVKVKGELWQALCNDRDID